MAAEDEAITTSPIRSVSDEAPVKTAAQRSAEIRARQHSKFH
jgi:hypothetical protein